MLLSIFHLQHASSHGDEGIPVIFRPYSGLMVGKVGALLGRLHDNHLGGCADQDMASYFFFNFFSIDTLSWL